MDKDLSVVRWKAIIFVTVGLVFAVLAAFLVLTILVCRQKFKMARKRKEMLAERLNRRQWLVEQNNHVINHLLTQISPIDSSIPLPRSSPGAFRATIQDEGANPYSDGYPFESRESTRDSFDQQPYRQPLPFVTSDISSSSRHLQQCRLSNARTTHPRLKRSECYSSWPDSSLSQFDSIGSTAPSLHRIPERTTKDLMSSDGGTFFERDSGYSHLELSDMNQNSSFTGSDFGEHVWSQRRILCTGNNTDMAYQNAPQISFHGNGGQKINNNDMMFPIF